MPLYLVIDQGNDSDSFRSTGLDYQQVLSLFSAFTVTWNRFFVVVMFSFVGRNRNLYFKKKTSENGVLVHRSY